MVSVDLGCRYWVAARRDVNIVDVSDRSQKYAIWAIFDDEVEAVADTKRVPYTAC